MRVTGKSSHLSAGLKSYVKTRWNTVVEMFISFLSVYAEIRELLTKDDIRELFDEINVSRLTEITNFLKLFKTVSDELEADSEITCVKILPAMETILNHIKIHQNDSAIVKKMKTSAEKYIDENKKEVLPCNYELWTFFHPNFKRMHGFKSIDKDTVMQSIELAVQVHSDTTANENIAANTDSVSCNRLEQKSVFHLLQDDDDGDDGGNSVSNEINRYINSKHATVASNLLDWWIQHKETYPQLYQYFLSFAAIPATSASAERIFSDAGNIITNKRSRLTPKNVNMLAFLHKNHKIMN